MPRQSRSRKFTRSSKRTKRRVVRKTGVRKAKKTRRVAKKKRSRKKSNKVMRGGGDNKG